MNKFFNYMFLLLVLVFISAHSQLLPSLTPGWANWGGPTNNLFNWRANTNPVDVRINRGNVASIHSKWSFTAGPMSAPPTSAGDEFLYVPDWTGILHAINRYNGQPIWSFNITQFLRTNYPNSQAFLYYTSRTAPSIDGNYIYIGTLSGAVAICLNRFTGAVVWEIQLDTHPAAIITASPRIYNGIAYYVVSSQEETLANTAGYVCCSFRGSVVALKTQTGSELWRFYSVPTGFAGAAIWGGLAPVDTSRNQIIFATGNLYSVPSYITACQNATAHIQSVLLRDPCRQENDYSESVISLDLITGRLIWAQQVSALDTYIESCGLTVFGIQQVPPNPKCPPFPGQDADFGEAPVFIPAFSSSCQGTLKCLDAFNTGNVQATPEGVDAVYIGQKSGVLWALSADTGKLLFSSKVAPGGAIGGITFGIATNGTTVFYASSNSNELPVVLVNGSVIKTSSWGAYDTRTGTIKWETPFPLLAGTIGYLSGPLSYANGLVFSGSTELDLNGGKLFILDADTGAILWQKYFSDIAIFSVTIFDGTLYFGTGYFPAQMAAAYTPPYHGTLYAYGL